LLLFFVVLTLLVACSKNGTIIDWVPFVRVNGVFYVAHQASPGEEGNIARPNLGAEYARVRHKVAGNVSNPSYQPKDGDAAFLSKDTPLYVVPGYRPQFLLAVIAGDRISLYEAETVDGASRGRDLLDIEGKVVRIGINSPLDGRTEVAAISGGALTEFVNEVLNAPVRPTNPAPRVNDPVFLAFYLRDGVVIRRAYWPDEGELSRGIMLPEPARVLVAAALR
jgi:hypothetical protein